MWWKKRKKKNKSQQYSCWNRNILVVEDDDQLLQEYVRILSDSDYYVFSFQDGESAIALSEKVPFIVAVVDLTLISPVGGIAVIEELHKKQPNCQVIVATSSISDQDHETCIDLGVKEDCYIPKIGGRYRHSQRVLKTIRILADKPSA